MKVTILTASRNIEKYISQCIESVKRQTYSNWDMLVMDDCSSDQTVEIATLAAKDFPVSVMKNESRLYCSSTYAKLLSLANGDICAILDGDDTLEPNAIKKLVSVYEKNPKVDFIWTNHRWYNSDMTKFRKGFSSYPRGGTIFAGEDGLKHVYSHWRTFRTELREKGTLFRHGLKCTVDKDLGYNLEEVGRGGFLEDMLYNYRYHPSNMSHKTNQKAAWREIRIFHKNKFRHKSVLIK